MLICWAVLGGFVLDAIFGDPAWLPHPVVLMGKAIIALEKRLRTQFPKTPQGELCGGAVLAAILPVGTFLITALVCRLAAALHPLAELAVQMFWCGKAAMCIKSCKSRICPPPAKPWPALWGAIPKT